MPNVTMLSRSHLIQLPNSAVAEPREDEGEAVDRAVLGAPPLAQHERERIADAERADGDKDGEQSRTDVGGCAAVEAETA